jgi:NIPSNAP
VSDIVELRQYTMRPGRRDVLIDLFDAEFIEPQEAAGMTVVGQFRNIDDPNKFVWMRSYADMHTRRNALTAFYGGPVWKSRRDAANATIIDNDNVLLLRPARPDGGFSAIPFERGSSEADKGVVIATIYHIDTTAEKEAEFVEFFGSAVVPMLRDAGAPVIASFTLERSPNTFPALPVREGEHVFVWFSSFPTLDAYENSLQALDEMPTWSDDVEVLLSAKIREPQTLRLSPTVRSLLHGKGSKLGL